MDNVVSVYFSNVKMSRGGVGTGFIYSSSEYCLSCALQFCGGKTAVDGSGGYRAGSISSLSVADKFNFSVFLTETELELYKQKRTRSFCLLGRRCASFLRLNEFFRLRDFPESRFNACGGFGIFPKGDLTLGEASGFSRRRI